MIELKQVAAIEGMREQVGRVYGVDGLCPTLTTMGGGNLQPKIMEIKQATKRGSIEVEEWGAFDMSYPESKTRRGRVQEGGRVSPTITAQNQEIGVIEPVIGAIRGRNPENPKDRTVGIETEQMLEIKDDGTSNTLTTVQKDNVVVEPKCRIRKLTPRECWRLMGFSDKDFDRAKSVNSDSQLYKQAGNSIVVNVLEEIFRRML